jgi:hypothetical protein
MIDLPAGWLAEPGRGWPEIHCLIHEACGWRSALAYDLERAEDLARIEDIIADHRCEVTA